MNCGVGCRRGLDPALLWLWCRPAGYSSDSTPSLGTSVCLGRGPRNGQKKNLIQTKTSLLKIPWDLLFFKEEFYIELNIIKTWFNLKNLQSSQSSHGNYHLFTALFNCSPQTILNTPVSPFPTDKNSNITNLHLKVCNSSTLILDVKI